MAIVDADYCFISIDVGAYGASSDSNVFKNKKFYKKMEADQLHIPQSRKLPKDNNGTAMPFVFVGDEAFALSDHVLRPYPHKNLSPMKRIYNIRLTTARRKVECAFGIYANKWRIFHRPLDVNSDFCDIIIKSCCALHNFVRKKHGIRFEDTLYSSSLEDIPITGTRGNTRGVAVREYFTKYFISDQGSVSWQYDKM